MEEGSEGFLSVSVASQITGFTSIESQLTIQSPAESHTQELQACTGIPTLTFADLSVYFLKGMGIPCPNLFLQAQHHFANFDMDLVWTWLTMTSFVPGHFAVLPLALMISSMMVLH